jgi:hypothetical protein
MAPNDIASSEVGKPTEVEVEDTKAVLPQAVITHYAPVNEEERELDKRVNWKLDITVLLILSISFIVRERHFRCVINQTNNAPSSVASTRPTSVSWQRAVSSKMPTCTRTTSPTHFPS